MPANAGSIARWVKPFAASPAKSATLGALAVVLVAVVTVQVMRRPAASQASETDAAVDDWENPPAFDEPQGQAATARPVPKRRPAPRLPDEMARDVFACAWLSDRGREGGAPDETEPQDRAAREFASGSTPPAQAAEQTWTLEGTILSADPRQCMAIIGGRNVRVGDRLDDYELDRVGPRSATLRRGTATVVLTMP
ncbi:MAG: hypothetical protein IT449_15825 [Phycisphaerales bacterium]|nr:hypothetical protein [Phycisphaerales bacterium]